MAKKATEKVMEVAVAEVVDYLRLTGKFAPALREVIVRKTTVEAAKKCKLKVTAKQLQKAADIFRKVNGLSKAADTQAWLQANGITVESLEEYLETNLLISKYKDHLEKKFQKPNICLPSRLRKQCAK